MALRHAVLLLCLLPPLAVAQYTRPDWPFADAAGTSGSTAIIYDDPNLQGWATGVESYTPGDSVDSVWQDTTEALGQAVRIHLRSYRWVLAGR